MWLECPNKENSGNIQYDPKECSWGIFEWIVQGFPYSFPTGVITVFQECTYNFPKVSLKFADCGTSWTIW